ncbi:cobaltochelatase subunit CobN [bacterium]|nr:cobaltochelatase subunit CobN [bacterium]MCI0606318.1 cobaltochelatase subunit CobN [bacterium]
MIIFISPAATERLMVATASKALPADFPSVRVFDSATLQTDEQIDAFLKDNASDAGILIVRVLGGKSYFERGFTRLQQFCRLNERKLIALPGDLNPDAELNAISNVSTEHSVAAFQYLAAGGIENYKNLLLHIADTHLATAFGFEPPSQMPDAGLYHPEAENRFACSTLSLKEFAGLYWRESVPAIGILFYRAYWQSGDLAIIDSLIRQIEVTGYNALPVFCYSLRDEAAKDVTANIFSKYFVSDSKPTVDCVISLFSYAVADLLQEERTTTACGEMFESVVALGIPFVQAITTSLTVEEWEQSASGLPPWDAATKVVLPEFDGRIIGPLVGFRQQRNMHDDKSRDDSHLRSESMDDRIKACVNLAVRYSILHRKPNSEKRVAVVLTNFANRHGRIGSAVGLDTPASVVHLLKNLQNQGYTVTNIPENGNALMEELIECGGYDTQFLTEDQIRFSNARYTAGKYAGWFSDFPETSQTMMVKEWGPPPGSFYRHGDSIYVAGKQYGNVFVMIQPPRGFGENPLAVYHSGDLVPTHHYLGVYRWLRDVFRADAIVQCGKHGTLEWLPGKALGLSAGCYPELAIGDVPVFYPFIVNDPGEGAQAKRRMHACIIDHLIPPMAKAETYDELARLQQLLGTYANAERTDPEKAPLIQQEIWNAVVAANLHQDLGVDAKPNHEKYGEFIQHIDGYLCEIGDLQIRDGLHTLGQLPQGEQFINLALALIRLDSTGFTGIRNAIAKDLNFNSETINDSQLFGCEYTDPLLPQFVRLCDRRPARTHGDIVNRIDDIARKLVTHLAELHFDKTVLNSALRFLDFPPNGKTGQTLEFLIENIIPKLNRTDDEITNLLSGLEGRSVPPGPSGAPTRGMINVLPTGRNFYSVDARAIPSPFAWQVGQRLGNDLLQQYLDRNGNYPESIGLTIWGTSNMRTQGDDIAEALWLMGMRPVWQTENNRMTGLEVISLEELKRPRIDVIVRMSGFFRDAFPGIVKLLDHAVNVVAELDEPEHQNFMRKHIQFDESELSHSGVAMAKEKSRYRLFSNKPGSYGTGILKAISESNWETSNDLARIYLEWGGYAYTNSLYGEPAQEEFQRRLKATDIAVQNKDNYEHDIFDSDDYMQFHGGMIAAIRSLAGHEPMAVLGDSGDPQVARNRDLHEEARRIFRARVANPKWLRAMQRHGYKGALEMAATVDYLFGYDATAQVVDDWMYQQVAEKYVLDGTSRAFCESNNPWALREMTGRLLEAAGRGMWSAPDVETLNRLKKVFLNSEAVLEQKGERG